jgi:hypothetical protein
MTNKYVMGHLSRRLVVPTVAAVVIGFGTLVGLALPQYSISQKGREYHPGEISIKEGETLPPNSHSTQATSSRAATDITFTMVGDFDVLCAIHPKMRLRVHVQ